MNAPSKVPQPSPEKIFDTLNAYQQTAALKSGIELDVFTAIGAGLETAAAIAAHCRASERGIRILCDYLTILGFLRKENQRYALSPDAAMFLDRRSPACMASLIGFVSQPYLTENFRDLTAVVRKGGTALSEEGTIAPENPIWVDFARSMAPMMIQPAERIAELLKADEGKPWKVLDIAAGHGLFGITLAKHNRNAQIVAVDWAAVLEVAKENARAAGVAERYSTLAGSAFEVDFGRGYDVVLLTNFLHHFDVPTCETLLRKVHAALVPGGRVATLEFVPNEDRVTPPATAKFGLMMLGTTASGDAYTFAEYDRMFRNAGFSSSILHPIPPTPQQVLVTKRAE